VKIRAEDSRRRGFQVLAMKLIKKDIEKDGHGEITLLPEEPEDMWHTYNLIMVGDRVRASTIR
jgi:protein pelota